MRPASLRSLLSAEYVPFGSQYYRAPSPQPAEWERDLKNFAALGFNTVKFWVQWRWNHPAENRFYFDDIDRLMDIAQKNNLRVMLNTIVDVAPGWIYRKYPDAAMVTLDGRRIGPQTQPHRQIGGLGVCFNHGKAMGHLFRFLRTAVRRYKNHPALEIWNVGSEPELTSSMGELRLYADNAGKIGDMLCYCGRCREEFKRWLEQKYRTIEALNLSWNRNHRTFADVEIPMTRNTFNDMIDWRMFFVDTLGENVRRRFEVARAEDKGKHPLMCHHVFIQGFPVTSTANDPWNVGRFGDLHGFTQMDDPMMVDVLRSCARGKPVISAEMLMLFGYTLDLPKPVEANDIKRFVFTGVAGNLKGFIFWQYRPELLGRESPAWGLTFLDGSPTPWLQWYAEVNRVLQKNASRILDGVPRAAEIALLYSPENQVFAWEATGSEKSATGSLMGIHRALYERNFNVDFIHAAECHPAILSRYKVIFVPFPYYLRKKVCRALTQWLEEGGTLIGEAYFAGWNVEEGKHADSVPGQGLHRVFKARQGVVSPGIKDGNVEIEVTKKLPFIAEGTSVYGAFVKETIIPEGAEVLAKFKSGEAAVTVANHGKGKAILIGTYLGLSYHRSEFPTNGDLIASLAALEGEIPRAVVMNGSKVRVDVVMTRRNEAMVILRNFGKVAVRDLITIPEVLHGEMVEQFSDEHIPIRAGAGGSSFDAALNPGEVKVFCV